ncbi:MAG: (d)CMP kinase [Erysipelotrichaceae bacterium]|nr:(d)CMP kinase [Erysipelotrichaceae bacterium]
MKKINIAIDGPSAAGKSSIAKIVAKKLGYVHLDTGAMYRSIALKCLLTNTDMNDDAAMDTLLAGTDIRLTEDGKVFLDGQDVSAAIRQNEISMMASTVSAKSAVRVDLVRRQQKMAEAKGFIMDGRDIGTVVLPDAELKIFQTASVEARAQRRALENQSKGLPCDLEMIKKDIEQRDYQDTHREHSPLRKADDAVELDTSDMSIEEVVECVLDMVQKVTGD